MNYPFPPAGIPPIPADDSKGSSFHAVSASPESGIQPTTDEKTMGLVCHLIALVGYTLPGLGNIIAPLVFWLVKKDQSAYLDFHGKEALNFQISIVLLALCCIPLVFILIGIPLLIALGVFGIAMPIVAAIKAQEGRLWRYPFTLRLIK